MYEAPSEDPRDVCRFCGNAITEWEHDCPAVQTTYKTEVPMCEYCGFEIEDHPQRCAALDDGHCHPDPFNDVNVDLPT